jgi:ammonia channel protein AmtB
MSGLIYPVVAHWAWSTVGWASAFNAVSRIALGNGVIDFAGSGVVHMVGGSAAVIMAYFVGLRKNRFTASWERRGISLFNSQDPSWVALGFVAITAPFATVETWGAVIIGNSLSNIIYK